MKIVVDTNIIFSGILNSTSRIGQLLLTSKKHFQFYTCDFLRQELSRHKIKLLKLTKLPEDDLAELETLITKNISFINEALYHLLCCNRLNNWCMTLTQMTLPL